MTNVTVSTTSSWFVTCASTHAFYVDDSLFHGDYYGYGLLYQVRVSHTHYTHWHTLTVSAYYTGRWCAHPPCEAGVVCTPFRVHPECDDLLRVLRAARASVEAHHRAHVCTDPTKRGCRVRSAYCALLFA